MKITVGLVGLLCVGIFGWYIGSRLSADAIGMAVGVLFGILAGIPAALMVLASRQQADRYYGADPAARRGGRNARISRADQMPYAPPAPVIVFAGNPAQHQLNQPVNGHDPRGMQPPQNQYVDLGPSRQAGPPDDRQFRVVGEQEEWIDAW